LSVPGRVVSVIGASSCTPEEEVVAEEVGRRLAQAGAVLVCGGGAGVMEAACRGARRAGGLTLGILPGDQASAGNEHLSLALPTGLGEARNVLVVRAGEAVIAIGGGTGTLSEIAHALRLGKPVIGLHTWRAESPQGGALPIQHVASAAEAVEAALTGATR
jgi:hypothetical protein